MNNKVDFSIIRYDDRYIHHICTAFVKYDYCTLSFQDLASMSSLKFGTSPFASKTADGMIINNHNNVFSL